MIFYGFAPRPIFTMTPISDLTIFLVQGHLVKNPNTQRAKSLREIPAAHRIVISGTPIQNHLQVGSVPAALVDIRDVLLVC